MDRTYIQLLFLLLASLLTGSLSGDLGSSCTKDRECKVDSSYCFSGVCTCKHYHAQLGATECLESKLLGRECLVDDQCSLRVANSICKEGYCRCSLGFVRFRKHTCLGPAKPGDVCYSDEHCHLWSTNSHCQFLIPKLFGKCVCDGEGNCEESESLISSATDPSATADTLKPDATETPERNNDGEMPDSIREKPSEEGEDLHKTKPPFVDPFLHQKEHLQGQSSPEETTELGKTDSATSPEDVAYTEDVTETTSATEEATTASFEAPADGVKYRVETGQKSSTKNDSDVVGVSLGYSCRSDGECQKSDAMSRCLNGVCDCAFSYNEAKACNSRNTGCGPETFQCRESGKCISWFFVCDGRDDCPDKSDEDCQGVKCPDPSFRCGKSEVCVSLAAICNGVKNCPNGEDELFCSPNTRNSSQGCPHHTFQCANGQCLPKFEFCNAIPKCADGSDESPLLCSAQPLGRKIAQKKTKEHCPFECGNARCRSTAIVCSGRDGCGDNSDEANCSVCRCPPNEN